VIKTLILDFDGVILDSVPIKDRCFIDLFTKYSPEIQHQAKLFWTNTRGMHRSERFKKAFSTVLKIDLTDTCLDHLTNHYKQYVMEEIVTAPWVDGASKFLASETNRPIYVVSATPLQELQEIIELRKLNHYIKDCYGAPLSKVDSMSLILEKENIKPAEALFIGDALADLEAARKLTIHFLGMVQRSRLSPFQSSVSIIQNFRELDSHLIHYT